MCKNNNKRCKKIRRIRSIRISLLRKIFLQILSKRVRFKMEGKQLVKLKLALAKALESTRNSCSKEKFNDAFPILKGSLDDARDKICEFLVDNCQEEFKNILTKRNIPLKLKQLDGLKEAENVTLEPHNIAEATFVQSRKKEIDALDSMIEFYNMENEKLINSLKEETENIAKKWDYLNGFVENTLCKDMLIDLESSV